VRARRAASSGKWRAGALSIREAWVAPLRSCRAGSDKATIGIWSSGSCQRERRDGASKGLVVREEQGSNLRQWLNLDPDAVALDEVAAHLSDQLAVAFRVGLRQQLIPDGRRPDERTGATSRCRTSSPSSPQSSLLRMARRILGGVMSLVGELERRFSLSDERLPARQRNRDGRRAARAAPHVELPAEEPHTLGSAD
jgi:hypothetical protein